MATLFAAASARGTDMTAVVDGQLRPYGVDRLRIADACVMPRITAGNTMAPLERSR
jgi:choline dehydrogenase-like flavoprotein